MFYMCLLNQETLRLDIYFPKYDFSRVFGTQKLFDNTQTGLVALEMNMYTK